MTGRMDELTAIAETSEAAFMARFHGAAPTPVRSALAMARLDLGGGVALSVRNDPTGYWSKALGFGIDAPVTASLVGEIVDFYRSQESAGATLQIAPAALPRDWDAICERNRLTEGTTWLKLACRVDAFVPGSSDLRVGRVAAAEADAWASVVLRGFGMPDVLLDFVAAGALAAGCVPVAAWDGGEMVAAAAVFLNGQAGQLVAAATLPGHRGQGAQSALLALRAREAQAAGCTWLVAETGRPAAGEPSPSLDNLRRAGLQPLYERPNWLWRPR